jgi:hypothetical protein
MLVQYSSLLKVERPYFLLWLMVVYLWKIGVAVKLWKSMFLFFRLHHSVVTNKGKTKVRIPILLEYASFYMVYYKDIVKFQILYLQVIC